MDFRLSEEQQLLRDSARRYFTTEGSADARRRRGAAQGAEDWARLAEFGWIAAPVPEAFGGLGSAIEDIAVLCEEMGRGLALASFIGGALLPARVLASCAEQGRGQRLLRALADNTTRLAVALYEPDRRYELRPAMRAVAMDDGSWMLSGLKSLVAGGAEAEVLVVAASVDSAKDEDAEPAMFAVRTDQAGVVRRVYETLDGVRVADFHLEQVVIPAAEQLVAPACTLAILENALDEATLCLCAETLGCMDQAIALTADYLKVRKQFGKTLAEFQVLQHAVAEMSIDANSARSTVYRAMSAMTAPRRERQRAISGCFIKVMQAAKSVTGTAVHLHGGIGMSCEYAVGHFLRRVLVSERAFGDREHHLARYLG